MKKLLDSFCVLIKQAIEAAQDLWYGKVQVKASPLIDEDVAVDDAFFTVVDRVILAVEEGNLKLDRSKVIDDCLFLLYEYENKVEFIVVEPYEKQVFNSTEPNFTNLRPSLVTIELKRRLTEVMKQWFEGI
ncbi:MAG: hypothetical protein UW41_C0002G0072 [Candidatus Collierbacteria bacterium GW2011_GWC2_44_18]|uniref:Uncharacterized protein n=1 Tax=Candidatus Collierbacteria bacterium GW2011_GWC2_44_18 TaxID=1618392 RepID=A0A0G1HRM3_9BACT|nr:MAG: hypothetical protein UW16_C0010G0007 [Microgenomates group bacterium GW2011_GWC1_44_10]KKT49796.1 MAG: hypothetical protein UW41_C0002G0072 [Candidatus Collierbacteria bacterium GW2011_GWC2_44_18]